MFFSRTITDYGDAINEAIVRSQIEQVDLIFDNPSYDKLSGNEKLSILEEFLGKSKEICSYAALLREDVKKSMYRVPQRLVNHQDFFFPELMSFDVDFFVSTYSDYYLKPRAFVDTRDLSKGQVCFIEALEALVKIYHERGTLINLRALYPVLLGALGNLSIDGYKESYGLLSSTLKYLPEDYAGPYIATNVLSLDVTLNLMNFIEDTDFKTLPSLEHLSGICRFIFEGYGDGNGLTEESEYFLYKAEELLEVKEDTFIEEIFEYFSGQEGPYESPEQAQKALFLDEESLNRSKSLIYCLVPNFYESMNLLDTRARVPEKLASLYVASRMLGDSLREALKQAEAGDLSRHSSYETAYSRLNIELEGIQFYIKFLCLEKDK